MPELYIGLMSGTSLDGVDAALVDFAGDRPRLVHTHFAEYPADLQAALRRICYTDAASLQEVGQLDAQLGEYFAACTLQLLRQAQLAPHDVIAIGSHGQTLFHAPDVPHPFTWQIGDPHRIAERTGIPVVADFRRRDVAAGGQGAPLAPAFHRALFGDPIENRVLVNIGGIANISVLPADPEQANVGFDTGPGNTLMNSWIHAHCRQPFDRNGEWARSGHISAELLEIFLSDPYFALPPPKSTGQERFSSTWLQSALARMAAPVAAEDVQATLTALTARSIACALRAHGSLHGPLIVCGGGAHNRYLLELLAAETARPLQTTGDFGIPPEWVEAVGFAWLARQRLLELPSNLPTATGAERAVSLGAICA